MPRGALQPTAAPESSGLRAQVVTTFGAPVGGLLFSIEVTSNFYCVQNLPSSFYAAVMGLLFVRKVVAVALRRRPWLAPT